MSRQNKLTDKQLSKILSELQKLSYGDLMKFRKMCVRLNKKALVEVVDTIFKQRSDEKQRKMVV